MNTKQVAISLSIVGTILIMAATKGWARPLTDNEKKSDLIQLSQIVDSAYGPLEYKKNLLGISLDQQLSKYLAQSNLSQSNREFYDLLMSFIADFQDSHFGGFLTTTQTASLPFNTDLIQGRVLIDNINRSKLPEATFPFQQGDEILSMNATPISTVVDSLQKTSGSGYNLTARRRATMMVSFRDARRTPVPSGDVTLEIKRGESNIVQKTTLKWDVAGEAIDENDLVVRKPSLLKLKNATNYDMISVADYWAQVENPQTEKSFRCSGKTRIAIPEGATVISMTPFVAYYHPTIKGNIGYLRIPEYLPTNPITGQEEYETRFALYEYAIHLLEKNTVGLVIDQDHNCGGSVEWLHRILGLFIQTPVKAMQFELLGTKAEYLEFKKYRDSFPESTFAFQGLTAVLDLVKSTWEQGTSRLTTKTSIDGAELIQPHHVNYTKPIVMLIDELSGSGGDAFPALMQGNKKATLLGTRTMGAGGHVEATPNLNYSQLNIRITKSLFYRPDGVAVENNGASPDINYSPSADDFRYGYRNYQAFYLNELAKKIQ